jgi:hypothetical protein
MRPPGWALSLLSSHSRGPIKKNDLMMFQCQRGRDAEDEGSSLAHLRCLDRVQDINADVSFSTSFTQEGNWQATLVH